MSTETSPRLNWFFKSIYFFMACCLGVMATLVFTNVVLRYGFHTGIAATEEISRLLFVWLVFAGALAAYPKCEHMAFTGFVIKLVNKPLILNTLTAVLRMLVISACSLLAYGAWHQIEVGWDSKSVILQYPLALIPMPVFICAIGIALFALFDLITMRPSDIAEKNQAAQEQE